MKEETKFKLFIGLISLLILCSIVALALKIESLGVACLIAWVAIIAHNDATSSIQRAKQAEDEVREKGIDWAVRELAVDGDIMPTERKDGLKRGIRNLT